MSLPSGGPLYYTEYNSKYDKKKKFCMNTCSYFRQKHNVNNKERAVHSLGGTPEDNTLHQINANKGFAWDKGFFYCVSTRCLSELLRRLMSLWIQVNKGKN